MNFLSQGWAFALAYALFEYAARERIANRQNLGMWGFHLIDNVNRFTDARLRGGVLHYMESDPTTTLGFHRTRYP